MGLVICLDIQIQKTAAINMQAIGIVTKDTGSNTCRMTLSVDRYPMTDQLFRLIREANICNCPARKEIDLLPRPRSHSCCFRQATTSSHLSSSKVETG